MGDLPVSFRGKVETVLGIFLQEASGGIGRRREEIGKGDFSLFCRFLNSMVQRKAGRNKFIRAEERRDGAGNRDDAGLLSRLIHPGQVGDDLIDRYSPSEIVGAAENDDMVRGVPDHLSIETPEHIVGGFPADAGDVNLRFWIEHRLEELGVRGRFKRGEVSDGKAVSEGNDLHRTKHVAYLFSFFRISSAPFRPERSIAPKAGPMRGVP